VPAKKKLGETDWKQSAIGRWLAEEAARITKLEALPARPACRACWGAPAHEREANPRCERCGGDGTPVDMAARARTLKAAHARLGELKQLKRATGGLLVLTDLLGDDELLERAKRFPRGSEKVLAALDRERTHIVERYGSVAKYAAHRQLQRSNAKAGRSKSDKPQQPNVADLVAALSKKYPTNDDATARNLWEEFGESLIAAYGERNVERLAPTRYQYKFWPRGASKSSSETIGLKHFGQLLRDARQRLLRASQI
jgi:hypothetical protein